MFEALRREIFLLAIRRCLKKRAPSRFAYSANIDFFSTKVLSEDRMQKVLIDSVSGCSIRGRLWEEDRFEAAFSIPICDLQFWAFSADRFYGYQRIGYSNLRSFWISEILRYPLASHLWNKAFQSFYNATLKVRQDRITLLQNILDNHHNELSNEEQEIFRFSPKAKSHIEILTDLHGQRVFGHPKRHEFQSKLLIALESLVVTEDLKKDGHRYALAPKAIVTLSQFAEEERRSRQNVTHNKRILWLTMVLVIATVASALADWQRLKDLWEFVCAYWTSFSDAGFVSGQHKIDAE